QNNWLYSLGAIAMAMSASPLLAQIHSSATPEIRHDVSPSLHNLANNVSNPQSCAQQPAQLLPNSTGLSIGQNFCGYTPKPSSPICTTCAIASDDSGAAGPNHYFQTENYSATIFDKAGQVVLGPFPTATFWSGFSSPSNTCSAG